MAKITHKLEVVETAVILGKLESKNKSRKKKKRKSPDCETSVVVVDSELADLNSEGSFEEPSPVSTSEISQPDPPQPLEPVTINHQSEKITPFLSKPKLLLVKDSVTQPINVREVEMSSNCRIRTARVEISESKNLSEVVMDNLRSPSPW